MYAADRLEVGTDHPKVVLGTGALVHPRVVVIDLPDEHRSTDRPGQAWTVWFSEEVAVSARVVPPRRDFDLVGLELDREAPVDPLSPARSRALVDGHFVDASDGDDSDVDERLGILPSDGNDSFNPCRILGCVWC